MISFNTNKSLVHFDFNQKEINSTTSSIAGTISKQLNSQNALTCAKNLSSKCCQSSNNRKQFQFLREKIVAELIKLRKEDLDIVRKNFSKEKDYLSVQVLKMADFIVNKNEKKTCKNLRLTDSFKKDIFIITNFVNNHLPVVARIKFTNPSFEVTNKRMIFLQSYIYVKEEVISKLYFNLSLSNLEILQSKLGSTDIKKLQFLDIEQIIDHALGCKINYELISKIDSKTKSFFEFLDSAYKLDGSIDSLNYYLNPNGIYNTPAELQDTVERFFSKYFIPRLKKEVKIADHIFSKGSSFDHFKLVYKDLKIYCKNKFPEINEKIEGKLIIKKNNYEFQEFMETLTKLKNTIQYRWCYRKAGISSEKMIREDGKQILSLINLTDCIDLIESDIINEKYFFNITLGEVLPNIMKLDLNEIENLIEKIKQKKALERTNDKVVCNSHIALLIATLAKQIMVSDFLSLYVEVSTLILRCSGIIGSLVAVKMSDIPPPDIGITFEQYLHDVIDRTIITQLAKAKYEQLKNWDNILFRPINYLNKLSNDVRLFVAIIRNNLEKYHSQHLKTSVYEITNFINDHLINWSWTDIKDCYEGSTVSMNNYLMQVFTQMNDEQITFLMTFNPSPTLQYYLLKALVLKT